MVTRIVIVEFHPGVTPQEITDFAMALRVLAARTPNLVRMACGEHHTMPSESALGTDAPAATFGNFVSVWEFEDEQALDGFLQQAIHGEMVRQRFQRVVRKRYIANFH